MIVSQCFSASTFFLRAPCRARMGGALACHEPRLSFGLRARLRQAQPYGALPQMVPKEDIPTRLPSAAQSGNKPLVGPAVAGLRIYSLGVGATYFFCFAASLSAVCLWLGIRLQPLPHRASAGGVLQHMAEGLNFIRQNQIYYTFIGMIFFNSVFGMSYLILMPVFARNVLHVGSQGFGFLQSVGGAGALVGVLAVAWFSHSRKKGCWLFSAPPSLVFCSSRSRCRTRIRFP